MSRPGMAMTPEAEEERRQFEREYGDRGCTCFISPPCGHCMHPGNPVNQDEDDECWQPEHATEGGAE